MIPDPSLPSKVCRICLKYDNNMKHNFNSIYQKYLEPFVSKWNIMDPSRLSMFNRVCYVCLAHVKRFYVFTRVFKQSQEYLESYVNGDINELPPQSLIVLQEKTLDMIVCVQDSKPMDIVKSEAECDNSFDMSDSFSDDIPLSELNGCKFKDRQESTGNRLLYECSQTGKGGVQCHAPIKLETDCTINNVHMGRMDEHTCRSLHNSRITREAKGLIRELVSRGVSFQEIREKLSNVMQNPPSIGQIKKYITFLKRKNQPCNRIMTDNFVACNVENLGSPLKLESDMTEDMSNIERTVKTQCHYRDIKRKPVMSESKRCKRVWAFIQSFSDQSQAEIYIRAEKNWGFRCRNAKESGWVKYYRCNKVKTRGEQCDMQLKLVCDRNAVSLYSSGAHTCHQIAARNTTFKNKFNFPDGIKKVIDIMYLNKSMKPREIYNVLCEKAPELSATLRQINYYLVYLRKCDPRTLDLTEDKLTRDFFTETLEDDPPMSLEQKIDDKPKKRGRHKKWSYHRTFHSKADAYDFIKSELCWSVHTTHQIKRGSAVYYRCNNVQRRGVQCHAGVKLICDKSNDNVVMFRIKQHTCDRISTKSKHTISEDFGLIIKELVKDKLKPREIYDYLYQRFDSAPTIYQVIYYVAQLRRAACLNRKVIGVRDDIKALVKHLIKDNMKNKCIHEYLSKIFDHPPSIDQIKYIRKTAFVIAKKRGRKKKIVPEQLEASS